MNNGSKLLRSRHQEQLLRAQREVAIGLETARFIAESAVKAKDEFLAIVSHELRGPLATVAGWTYMLKNRADLDPVDLTVALEAIKRSAKLQIRLLEDLLDQSSIPTGRLQIYPVPILVEEAVQQAVDGACQVAMTKRISIKLEKLPDASA